MKNIFTVIVFALALIAVPSCDKARLRNIDKEISGLEQEDQRILQELSQAIDDLEKALLGKIEEANEKLNHDIDAAVLDMLDYLKTKMDANQDYLEVELAKRKAECDETVAGIRSKAKEVTDGLNDALDKTQERLQKAIKDGDEDVQEKLLILQENIGRAYDYMDAAEASLKDWEKRIEKLNATGMYDHMDKINETIQQLMKYDIQEEIDNVENYAKKFATIQLDKLSKDRLDELHALMNDMNGWVGDAQSFADECETKTGEMADNLDDWRGRADDLYGSVDDLKNTVNQGFLEITIEYDKYASQAEGLLDDVESNYSTLEDMLGQIESAASRLDGITDDLDDALNELQSDSDNLQATAEDIYTQAQHLYDETQNFADWCDEHPWIYEQ